MLAAIVLFIGILIGLNFIPEIIKKHRPKTEKSIQLILAISTLIFLVSIGLLLNSIRIKGIYSNLAVNLIFLMSCLLYFAMVRNRKIKILIVVLLILPIIIALLSSVFSQKINEQKLPNGMGINITKGGIMTCASHISLSKSWMGIFEEEIYHDSRLCLQRIYKIEVVAFEESHAELLLYHRDEQESQNPFPYRIDNEMLW
ncbi:MAG: hypothetical protein MRZ79_27210 [Bacteroidia bacterium]|nr:hypothetical protein [Bacteroidia bacterium]